MNKTLFSILSTLLLGLFLGCTGEMSTEVTLEEIKNAEELPYSDIDDITDEPQDTTPVGPVSQYGQLQAANPSGWGFIYGACSGIESGKEVQVRGMSLYWSIMNDALAFYTRNAITTMVKDMKIEVIRLAIATDDSWGNVGGYIYAPDYQLSIVDTVINAAVENDIYVIIDWHSHHAEEQILYAEQFFNEVASRYGHLDNVIFELYNEPKGDYGYSNAMQYWPTIQNYASYIISIIRLYSDNLVIVGTPFYSQYPNVAVSSPIFDTNVAYSFHYYANSHSIRQEGENALNAIQNGFAVFVTEWGTGNADGGGTPNLQRNDDWQAFMNNYKLSWANWSASRIKEGTAAFSSGSTDTTLFYSTSGELVKSYLESNPVQYTRCKAK